MSCELFVGWIVSTFILVRGKGYGATMLGSGRLYVCLGANGMINIMPPAIYIVPRLMITKVSHGRMIALPSASSRSSSSLCVHVARGIIVLGYRVLRYNVVAEW